MEGLGGRQKERGAEQSREEEICGEIIIPSVTVATFCEVDVNKILSNTIHFNFSLKKRRMVQRVLVATGMRCMLGVGGGGFGVHAQRGGGWRRVLLTDCLRATVI